MFTLGKQISEGAEGYTAVDKDGCKFSYPDEPEISEIVEGWVTTDHECTYLGQFEYEGDWRDSLKVVQ